MSFSGSVHGGGDSDGMRTDLPWKLPSSGSGATITNMADLFKTGVLENQEISYIRDRNPEHIFLTGYLKGNSYYCGCDSTCKPLPASAFETHALKKTELNPSKNQNKNIIPAENFQKTLDELMQNLKVAKTRRQSRGNVSGNPRTAASVEVSEASPASQLGERHRVDQKFDLFDKILAMEEFKFEDRVYVVDRLNKDNDTVKLLLHYQEYQDLCKAWMNNLLGDAGRLKKSYKHLSTPLE